MPHALHSSTVSFPQNLIQLELWANKRKILVHFKLSKLKFIFFQTSLFNVELVNALVDLDHKLNMVWQTYQEIKLDVMTTIA